MLRCFLYFNFKIFAAFRAANRMLSLFIRQPQSRLAVGAGAVTVGLALGKLFVLQHQSAVDLAVKLQILLILCLPFINVLGKDAKKHKNQNHQRH